MGPLDGCSERLLPRIGVAACLQHVEPLCEAVEQLGGREDAGTGSSQLDGQRQAIQTRAELVNDRGRLYLCALTEEGDAFVVGKRRKRIGALTLDTEQLSTGDEQRKVGAGRHKLGELRRCL